MWIDILQQLVALDWPVLETRGGWVLLIKCDLQDEETQWRTEYLKRFEYSATLFPEVQRLPRMRVSLIMSLGFPSSGEIYLHFQNCSRFGCIAIYFEATPTFTCSPRSKAPSHRPQSFPRQPEFYIGTSMKDFAKDESVRRRI